MAIAAHSTQHACTAVDKGRTSPSAELWRACILSSMLLRCSSASRSSVMACSAADSSCATQSSRQRAVRDRHRSAWPVKADHNVLVACQHALDQLVQGVATGSIMQGKHDCAAVSCRHTSCPFVHAVALHSCLQRDREMHRSFPAGSS